MPLVVGMLVVVSVAVAIVAGAKEMSGELKGTEKHLKRRGEEGGERAEQKKMFFWKSRQPRKSKLGGGTSYLSLCTILTITYVTDKYASGLATGEWSTGCGGSAY